MRGFLIGVLMFFVSLPVRADALSDIIGPVIPMGDSPWSWYDIASQANADTIIPEALAYTPMIGSALSGTFTLDTGTCGITLSAADTSALVVGDWFIVAWNSVDGNGTGRLLFIPSANTGTVATDSGQCGQALITDQAGASTQSGLTVYACTTQCKDEVTGHYDCTSWVLCSANGGGWAQYDPALAIYRIYLRTGNTDYLDDFREWTDNLWVWGLDHGVKYGVTQTATRNAALTSQFVRALDGHPERLPILYELLALSTTASKYDGSDNREAGYMLLFQALGAIADSDSGRRADYCTWIGVAAQGWVDYQNGAGFWSEKSAVYPYAAGVGVSPWRMFAVLQGLARAYRVMADAAICNDSALAADILTAIENTGEFIYQYGYSTANRGVYYDVEHPADGLTGLDYGGWRTGTVTANIGSPTITGSGTSFTTLFGCDGSDYIGISDQTTGMTWTYLVTACASNTSLTIDANYGTQVLTAPFWSGNERAPTGNSTNTSYARSPVASTACASAASYCVQTIAPDQTFTMGLLNGSRDTNRDLLWIYGWLYQQTGTAKWKTYGDEMMTISSGGPALGPGANYGGGMNPCDGPNCVTEETDYTFAITFCGDTDPVGTVPCQSIGSTTPFGVGPKRWAQMSGIGGADNYLAWREATAAPSQILPNKITGKARFIGNAR